MHDEAEVWFVRTDSLRDAEVAAAQELLSADERERQQRLRSPIHRRDFAVKRALVRLALSHSAHVDPRAWTFATAGNGRPCIASPDARDLDFNVSDTRGLVALLLTRGTHAAIDVERLERDVDIEPMARRFYSPEEQRAFFALEESCRPRRFLELWTAKEACIKALGAGFAHPFRSFTVHCDPLRTEGFHLEPLSLGEDYIATVAFREEGWRVAVREVSGVLFVDGSTRG